MKDGISKQLVEGGLVPGWILNQWELVPDGYLNWKGLVPNSVGKDCLPVPIEPPGFPPPLLHLGLVVPQCLNLSRILGMKCPDIPDLVSRVNLVCRKKQPS